MKILIFISMLLAVNTYANNSCIGQTASCFDQCTAQHISFQNSSRCDTYFDQTLGCHKAVGICDNPDTPVDDRCDQYDSVLCFDPCSGENIIIHFANSCEMSF